ncbi:toxin-antitoxin system YwqK family antitoxin [Gramella sp. KN1008]|uniref:toxin-antitoxin system YwqK family antitoxin n=1 Tax=Gramella sp. KN1008 TaxID=2529298 RepID=UPI00103B1E1A|nr:toxin-antitoxin system YwqK family antitoxin [Gramella sp. KN1008]TBW26794.1 hypothetical protein EZJ28_13205 [Gramella sp. KN1008]
MKKAPLLLLFLWVSYINAQENIEFESYSSIQEKASAAAEVGDFEKTIEFLEKVNKNDSMYITSLVSRSYYLSQLKRFDEALSVIETGLNTDKGKFTKAFYTNKAFALSNTNRKEKALKVYDEGLKIFPVDASLMVNKAILLEELERHDEALQLYKRAIFLNPLEKKTHIRLGQMCYRQHNLSQALMSFNFAILLDPDGENAFPLLRALNELVVVKNENIPVPDFSVSKDQEAFSELDLILENKLALNDRYETGSDIPVPLTKQNHMLFEQLKNVKKEEGFWTEVYLPMYEWISQSDYFEDFTYTLLYSIENLNYKKIVNRKTDEVKEFYGAFIEKWKENLQKKSHVYISNENLSVAYSGTQLDGIGQITKAGPKGKWEFYSAEGQRLATGEFDENGEREKLWTWFHTNGNIKETAMYVNGEVSGENMHYFEDGSLYIKTSLKNENLNGEYKVYNEYGALIQKKYFKDNELDGEFKSYFKIGEKYPEIQGNYINGKADGKAYEYFENGDVYTEMNFKNDLKNGVEKSFYRNGNVYKEMSYRNGELQGKFTEYHLNGVLSQEGYYSNGLLQGEWRTYHENGNLASVSNYHEGLAHDLYQEFDKDGKLYFEYDYRKGEIIAYRFYDKDENVLVDERKKGGEFYYKSFTPHREKNSEGLYDISGGRTGVWKYYDDNGILTENGNYIDDKPNGLVTLYFNSGKKDSEVNYVNGKMQGYAVFYFPNGQIQNHGLYENDLKQGVWKEYYIDGTPKAINFYHDNELHGEQILFEAYGKKYMTDHYNYGKLEHSIAFMPEGAAYDTIRYKQNKDEYIVKTHYPSGRLKKSITYLHGYKHGEFKAYSVEGILETEGDYFNNLQHGEWTDYRENGDVIFKRNFEYGSYNGKSEVFYENGQLDTEYIYNYGIDTGVWKSYHENGEQATQIPHENGSEHGEWKLYDNQGNLQLIRYYEYGRLLGYSYLDGEGALKKMIPLKNETGKIESFYSNGNPSRVFEVIGGDFHNNYNTYYFNGQLMEVTPYSYGLRHGWNIEYYENGKKKTEAEYLFDNLHGMKKEYYPNGTLKSETVYKNNIEVGPAMYYDSEGKIKKREEFLNGDAIKVEKFEG